MSALQRSKIRPNIRNEALRGPPSDIELVIDKNEHRMPLLFPSRILWCPDYGRPPAPLTIHKTVRKLPFGDYCLAGRAHQACVETKRSLDELANNLSGQDRHRAGDAFRRLADGCKHPYLMLDLDWAMLRGDWRSGQDHEDRPDPGRIQDLLFKLCVAYRFRVLGPIRARTPQTRRWAGDFVLRLLLAHAYPSAHWLDPRRHVEGGKCDLILPAANDLRPPGKKIPTPT